MSSDKLELNETEMFFLGVALLTYKQALENTLHLFKVRHRAQLEGTIECLSGVQKKLQAILDAQLAESDAIGRD